MENIIKNRYRLATEATIVVLSTLFYGLYNSEVLYRLQENSLFLGTSVFKEETLAQSAGYIVYLAKYCMQFLHWPIFAGIMFSLCFIGIERLLNGIKPLRDEYTILQFLPSVALTLSIFNLGYGTYDTCDVSFAASIVIGTLAATFLAWLQCKAEHKFGFKASAVFFVLYVILYFIIGIYACLAALLYSVSSLKDDKKVSLQKTAAVIVASLALGYISATYVRCEEFIDALLSPIPNYYFKESFIYAIVAALLCIGCIAAAQTNLNTEKELSKKGLIISALSVPCVMLLTFFMSYRDANFRTTIKIQHLAEDMKWSQLIDEVKNVEKPTIPIAEYRITALIQEGRIHAELFSFPCAYDSLNTIHNELEPIIYNHDQMLYTGFTNQSLWYCMEDWCSCARSVSLLRRMTLCAFLNEEYETAKRYLNLLKTTVNYSTWAEEFEGYIANRDKMFAKYPSLKKASDWRIPENVKCQNTVLSSLYPKYTSMDGRHMMNRLMLDLYAMNMRQFRADMAVAWPIFQNGMPKYLQEAVVMNYLLGDKSLPIEKMPISKDIAEQTRNYVIMARSQATGEKEFDIYKGTYIYYADKANTKVYKRRF